LNEDSDKPAVPAADLEQGVSHEPLAKKQSIPFDSRVNITVTSYRKRKHDPDGISCKAVLDGIVQAGFIADDSTSEVNQITFKSIIIKKEEEEKTVIVIED